MAEELSSFLCRALWLAAPALPPEPAWGADRKGDAQKLETPDELAPASTEDVRVTSCSPGPEAVWDLSKGYRKAGSKSPRHQPYKTSVGSTATL